MHDLVAMDDRTVPLLIVDQVGIGVDGDDPELNGPIACRRLPDPCEVEKVAAVDRDPVALAMVPHVEFASRHQAAVIGKVFPSERTNR